MTAIKTLAFFDLETTGFIKNGIVPKILELSIVACSVNDLNTCDANDVPRVLHKLTMCFNPDRSIDEGASKINGLYYNMLKDEQLFDEKATDLILSFLYRLQAPVCLVAHNGDSFDFPILKSAIKSAKDNLQVDVPLKMVDSLKIFRSLGDFTTNTLGAIYQRTFNEAIPKAHHAEGDVIALLKCAIFNKTDFIESAQNMATNFL